MNSINNVSYNPNFTGIKFDLKGVTHNKQRWENIAKIVESKTAKTKSEDFIEVITYNEGNSVNLYLNTFVKKDPKGTIHISDKSGEYQLGAEDEKLKEFFKRSDEYIAKKIIKFDKFCRKKDKIHEALGNFLHKTKGDDEDFAEKITDVVVNKMVDDEKKFLAKDKFLSSIDCYF